MSTEVERPSADDDQRHRRRRIVALVVGAVLLAAVVAGLVLWIGRGADEVRVDDVLDRYRSTDPTGTTAPEQAAGLRRPPPGVYTYDATGSERLSVLDTAQEWGPTMPATVTHSADGCWTLRLDYNTNHWREQEMCPQEGRLVERRSSGYQAFDFGVLVENTTVSDCEPPDLVLRLDADPGDSWTTHCEGSSPEQGTTIVSDGTNTFVGVEELRIGGRTVRALHQRLQRTLSGDQQGTQDDHLWYAEADGLLLRAELSIRAETPSPVGSVTYTESGEFQLTSLEPRS
jgi:hypothetical protein